MFGRVCSLIFCYQYLAMDTAYPSHVFQYRVHVFRRLVVKKMSNTAWINQHRFHHKRVASQFWLYLDNLYNFYIFLFLNYSECYLFFLSKRSYRDLLLSLQKHLFSGWSLTINVDDVSVAQVGLVITCFNLKMLSGNLKSLLSVLL